MENSPFHILMYFIIAFSIIMLALAFVAFACAVFHFVRVSGML